jgi:hypothetical protein
MTARSRIVQQLSQASFLIPTLRTPRLLKSPLHALPLQLLQLPLTLLTIPLRPRRHDNQRHHNQMKRHPKHNHTRAECLSVNKPLVHRIPVDNSSGNHNVRDHSLHGAWAQVAAVDGFGELVEGPEEFGEGGEPGWCVVDGGEEGLPEGGRAGWW